MAETFQTQDAKTVTDGDVAELTLQHGTTERVVSGTIRSFLDDEDVLRWEISNGGVQYPAIGFLPENVITKAGA